jgi:hypothetical protein
LHGLFHRDPATYTSGILLSSLLQLRTGVPAAPRRQARFVTGRAILPQHATEGAWYDVCAGRRRSDDQPGMVMLDFGGRREHVPAGCLEFRARSAPGRAARPLQRPRGRALAAALSLVPVGAAVIIAATRLGRHRHG